MWADRAKSETQAAARTWFVTLTLRPEEHYRALCRAELRCKSRAVEFRDLSPAEQFNQRHLSCGVEITKWLKRVRKNSQAPLRYLLVAEAHASGLPHYHALVHETSDRRVTRRQLDSWPLGHSKAKLVTDIRQAIYLCKYLSKDAAARVRASLHYGSEVPTATTTIGHRHPITVDVVKKTPPEKITTGIQVPLAPH